MADAFALAAWLKQNPQATDGIDVADLPNSHGGSFVTGLVNALKSGATLPGDVATGQADIRLPSESPDLTRVADLAGLMQAGALPSTKAAGEAVLGSGPIRAYHGSPHDFDRFDLSKIGTGEGAQAYGHGLYFAENPATAQAYRDNLGMLSGNVNIDGKILQTQADVANALGVSHPAALQVQKYGSDVERMRRLADQARNSKFDYERATAEPLLEAAKAVEGRTLGPPGRMYEVAIHADPERFLDWDKPLSRSFIEKNLEAFPSVVEADARQRAFLGPEKGYSGRAAYSKAADWNAAQSLSPENAADVSRRMAEAGIPGIKYLDQGSRAAGDGSRNYVTFSDDIVQILRKYGVSSIAALPPAVQMMLQKGETPPDAP